MQFVDTEFKLAISVHPLSEKYENTILFVFFSRIIFYKIIHDR